MENSNTNLYTEAHKAKELAMAARSIYGDYKKEETLQIVNGIRNLAIMGDMCMTINTYLDPLIIQRLEMLGYSCTQIAGDQRDPSYVVISWENS